MTRRVNITIGGIRVGVTTSDDEFAQMLGDRFDGFIDGDDSEPDFAFDVDIAPDGAGDPDEDVRVHADGSGGWHLRRGDFRAQWHPASRQGRIRQSANPYSIDTVLRLVHTIVLAGEGGFLMHAASAIKDGKAFVFAGVSGAGKTTLSRLAPPGVHVLTDEVSYVRRHGGGYRAYGTPFAGELARAGENLDAPLEAIYLLAQGPGNKVEPVGEAEAARAILANVLFFAEDEALVRTVFHSALELAGKVPVRRLTFTPDAHAWELIR